MRNLFISLTIYALLVCAIDASGEVTVKTIDYQGWKDCYELSNGDVRLVVVPQIGGRIMEYSIGGENVLWQNESELGKLTGADVGKKWRNYGGYKAWNAPQSRWRKPNEDYFYDSKPASIEVLPDQGLRITTSPIEHLGFRFIRDVHLSPSTSRVRIVEKMRNITDKPIEWSVWDVTQVRVPCWIAFPINNKSRHPDGWNVLCPIGHKMTQITRIGDLGVMGYKNVTENWCTDAMGGWMAYLKGQLAYTKHWSTRMIDVTYPDGGCDAAFFTADQGIAGGYAEMEVMGPIVKLKPGEETELIEDWFLTRVNQSANDVTDVVSRLKLLQKRGLLPQSISF